LLRGAKNGSTLALAHGLANNRAVPTLVLRLRERPRGLRLGLVAVACAAVVAIVVAVEPLLASTHRYELPDRRAWLGLPNAWNVLSNAPFALVGALGLARLGRIERALRPAALLCFVAIAAVAACSSYYHLAPSPARLVVDRLPITLAFAGLFAWVLGDRVHPRWVRATLWPGVLAALGALALWSDGGTGTGVLWPYALVQTIPLVAIPLLLMLFPGALSGSRFALALLLYVAGLACQALDAELFALGGLVSGHTVKHVLSAAASACLVPPRASGQTPTPAPAPR
jgi:hypothetical protein